LHTSWPGESALGCEPFDLDVLLAMEPRSSLSTDHLCLSVVATISEGVRVDHPSDVSPCNCPANISLLQAESLELDGLSAELFPLKSLRDGMFPSKVCLYS